MTSPAGAVEKKTVASPAAQAASRALEEPQGKKAGRKPSVSPSSAGVRTEKAVRGRELSVADVTVLQRSLGGSDVALKAAGRIHAEVQLIRQGKQSSTLLGYVVSGVGSFFSAFGLF